MKDVNVSSGIVPLGEFKAQAARILRGLRAESEPIVITQNGRAAAVVLSPGAFEEMRESNHFLEAVVRGLSDAEAGRTVDHGDVREWLKSWGTESEGERPA
ncbi:MAG: type II toxin-antitoxin system prevent-host-death family antitoxin [Myxococcota bacterium]